MLEQKVIDAIYNARTEVHYNSYSFRNKDGIQTKVELQGKIRCPVINASISHQTCNFLMDKSTWPRGIDPDICKKCECYINVSISKYRTEKKKE